MNDKYQELKDQLNQIQEQNKEILAAIKQSLNLNAVVTGDQIKYILSETNKKAGTGSIETARHDLYNK